MTFDLGEFYDTCLSIEHRLGILRANEAVREWWHSYQAELGPDYPRSPFVLGYQSTPSEVDYWVDFYYAGMPEFEGDLDAQGPQAAQRCRPWPSRPGTTAVAGPRASVAT